MSIRSEVPGQETRAAQTGAVEEAGYFEIASAHLYTVLHKVAAPVARVLLIGAFGPERHTSYIPWVRWARYLAQRRIECLRFDYRGVGESTGSLEEVSFDDWKEDVELLAGWLNCRSPRVPLALHGLELGALLASKAFAAGIGDALLLWAAPNTANEVLRPQLLRHVAIDNMFRYGTERKQMADYLQLIETQPIEVEGYRWSQKLWRDSFDLDLPAVCRENSACDRPVRTVQLDSSAEPLIKGSVSVLVDPDLTELFAENFEWLNTSLARAAGGC